jgi:hypothetical protein
MKSPRFSPQILGLGLGLLAAAPALFANVSAPKAREATLQAADKLLADQKAAPALPPLKTDPFIGKIDAPPPTADEPVFIPQNNSELLNRIAPAIPVRGTANLNGEWYLLTGQKRLKVGQTLTIDFEGQQHDVIVSAITSTTFTIQRGDASVTRSTRSR